MKSENYFVDATMALPFLSFKITYKKDILSDNNKECTATINYMMHLFR